MCQQLAVEEQVTQEEKKKKKKTRFSKNTQLFFGFGEKKHPRQPRYHSYMDGMDQRK